MSSRNIRIVLVNPTHPGNIGAAARAMKNMCLENLWLVSGPDHLGPEARARASGAEDVLVGAQRRDRLEDALMGCGLAVATSARTRSIPWPGLEPRACAATLVSEARAGPVALVFGGEKKGLSNAELDRCQFVVSIPANARYASLNLACAVQVMAYEIFRAMGVQDDAGRAPDPPQAGEALASSEEVQRFYQHLEAVLVQLEFLNPQNPRHLMRRLYRLFNRTRLQVNEVNILRGILSAFQHARTR